MEKETTVIRSAHTLMLEGRKKAVLSGVQAVCCFNDQEIVLETAEGELALLGEGLHIEELNLEEGRLNVMGDVSGLEYSDKAAQRERRGFFARRKK